MVKTVLPRMRTIFLLSCPFKKIYSLMIECKIIIIFLF